MSSNLKEILIQKNVQYSDLPKALIIHESLGVSFLLGVWAACFLIRPSYRAYQLFKNKMGEKKRIEKILKSFENSMENVKNRLMKKRIFINITVNSMELT